MKLIFKGDGATDEDIVLADDAASIYVRQEGGSRDYRVSQSRPAFAPWTRTFARGQRAETYRFTAQQEHASYAAAKTWLKAHLNEIPQAGTLTEVDDDGTTFYAAVLTNITWRVIGRSTETTYSFAIRPI